MSRILIKLLHPLPYWASAAPRREVRSVYFANYLWLSHILKKTAIFIIESSQAAHRGWVCVWIECRSIDCRRKVGYIQCSNTREQTTAKRFRILGPKFKVFHWQLAERMLPCSRHRGRVFCWHWLWHPCRHFLVCSIFRSLGRRHKIQLCKWVPAILRIQFAMHSRIHTAQLVFISIGTIW